MNWIDDPGAEDVMAQLGLKWVVAMVRMDQIDIKASRANFARAEKLNKEHAQSIAIAARNGNRIPRCVVRIKTLSSGRRVYVIASGNHRHESAAINGETEIPCYLVECTDSEFEILCKLANTTPGQGATKTTRARQAAEAVISKKMTEAQAAALFGVDKSSVNYQKRLIIAKEKIAARFDGPIKLAEDVAIAVAGMQADSVFNAAIDYAASATGKSVEAAKAIRDAAQMPEIEAVEFLRTLEKQESASKRTIRSSARTDFLGSITKIENTLRKHPTLDAADIPNEMKAEVRTRCLAIASLLKSL